MSPDPGGKGADQPHRLFFPMVRSENELPLVIPDTTEILPPDTTQHLAEVSPDLSTYTFDQTTPALDELQTGDVMVSGVAANAPEGFLRKVTDVTRAGSDVIVSTQQATLEEAISQGSFSFSQTLSPDSVRSGTGLPGVSLAADQVSACAACFSFELNDVVLYQDPQHPAFKITANGKIDLETSFDLSWEIRDNEIKKLSFSQTSEKTTELNVKSEWEAKASLLKAEIKVYSITLAPITLMAGVVPVIITPIVDVYVGLDGSVSLSLETGVNFTESFTTTLSYDNGSISFSAKPGFTFGFNPPKVSGELELKVYVAPAPTLKLYGVAGPWVKMKGYLKGKAAAQVQTEPPYFALKFGLYLGFEVPMGLKVEIFGSNLANFERVVFNAEQLLHEWSFLPPNQPSNPVPVNGAVNQGLTPLLSWYGSDVSGDALTYDVYFKAGDSNFGALPAAYNISASTFDPGTLTPSTTYYWKVLARNSTSVTNTSPVWSFITGSGGTLPGAFNKTSPENNATAQPTALTLDWDDSSGADGYAYCYDTSNDSDCSNWTAAAASQAAISGLDANTTYYWQVKATNAAGDTFADGSAGSFWSFTTGSGTVTPGEMVTIPAGSFQMGCDPAHNGGYSCSSSELPLHTITLDAYRIDKYEITNALYAQCVTAGNCAAPSSNASSTRTSYYNNPTYANYPVIFVSWDDAVDYCAWAGKRLPTEAEWEKAARGASDTRAYPWGDANPTCSLMNYWPDSACVGDTNAVGSYPAGASPYGVMDMAGNVWEWVNDWYSSSYYATSPASNPPGPANGTYKVLRGGSWSDSGPDLRVAGRYGHGPAIRPDYLGFRCAADPGN